MRVNMKNQCYDKWRTSEGEAEGWWGPSSGIWRLSVHGRAGSTWHVSHTHTHTHLTSLFPGLPGCAGTRKVKPIWILLKQETVSGSSISWAICKSAPRSRQTTMPAPHQSVFYRPDALPAAEPTASKHWRHKHMVCHGSKTMWHRYRTKCTSLSP